MEIISVIQFVVPVVERDSIAYVREQHSLGHRFLVNWNIEKEIIRGGDNSMDVVKNTVNNRILPQSAPCLK